MNALQLLASNLWIERLGWSLVHFLWEGALIAAAYAFARRWLTQEDSANARYVLGCTALASMLFAAFVTFTTMKAPGLPPAAGSVIAAVPASDAPAPKLATPPNGATASSVGPSRILPWVVVVWLIGLFVFSIRLVGSWVLAAGMRSSRVRPAPPEWQHILAEL